MSLNHPQALLMHLRDNAFTVACAMFATELLSSEETFAFGVEFFLPVNAC
jgi:hypothetical protein